MAARPARPRHRPVTATIREVVFINDPALRPAYRLLKTTFGPTELIPLKDWRSSLRERADGLWTDLAWHLLVAEIDGRVVGVATGNFLGNLNVGVVGYLVVAPEGRGQRLGPRLRDRLRRQIDRDARRVNGRPLSALVGEVKAENPWLRRLAGHPEVLPLNFPYYQPRLDPEHPVGTYVLYYESLGPVRSRLPVAELRRMLYTIWRRIYRIARPLDRSPFRAMMRALEGRRSVGRWRVPPTPASRRSPAS